MRRESSDYHEKDVSKQLKKTNYYDILDLNQNATQAEIKKSFKQMALKYHPDKNSAAYSKQVFHKVSQAYDTLSDSDKRNAYDQKQQLLKMPKNSSAFKEPTVFFYRSNQFYSDFDREFRRSSFDDARRRAQEERMEERARHEREKFRKEHNQKNKNQFREKANAFFKQYNSNKKSQEEKESEKNHQKFMPREDRNYFGFTKQKATQQKNTEYEQRRRQKQRKARLQKQRQRANKNMSMFMIFMLIVVLWVYLDYNKVSFKGPPVYSISHSTTHNISRFTQKLNSPFFVTHDYVERAHADDRFRLHIERKMDFAYIKLLSRVCNNAKHKQEELQTNLDIAKSAKSRDEITQKLDLLDLASCSKLHDLRQSNPVYFQGLFSSNSPKDQL